MVFHLANSFDLTNVSVQVILFLVNLALRTSLTFFGMEDKRSVWLMLILLILTLYGKYNILLYCFIVQSFIWIFRIERLHSIHKIWLVLIICLVMIISYCHLVLLHEKNWEDNLLAASQWFCKYICKISIQGLGPL